MNLDPILLAELQRGGPPLWVSGRTYPVGAVVRSPGNLQSYVRVIAGAGNADPSGGDANWMILSKRVEDAVMAVRDSLSAARTEAGWWRDQVNTNVYAARDAVQYTVNTQANLVKDLVASGRDAVQYTVNTQANLVKDLVASVRATVEGSGIRSVQRGVFGGYYETRQLYYYDMPIAPVNPWLSTVNLLTVEFPDFNTGSQKSIALAPDGTAVRVYVKAGGTTYTSIPAFSWEVIEWKR